MGGGGGGGGGRIWLKERLFPCEKLIDGRGNAFCKLVPHNFGQDCRYCISTDCGALAPKMFGKLSKNTISRNYKITK